VDVKHYCFNLESPHEAFARQSMQANGNLFFWLNGQEIMKQNYKIEHKTER